MQLLQEPLLIHGVQGVNMNEPGMFFFFQSSRWQGVPGPTKARELKRAACLMQDKRLGGITEKKRKTQGEDGGGKKKK